MQESREAPFGAPLVSVIVPIYNCAAYVGQCMESLLEQTMPDFEALCVDDGSSDGSLDVAKAVAAQDPRFHFSALPENRGQSAARNVALDAARGEYLVLLDADDYLVPEALEKLVLRAKTQQLDDLYFSGRSFYEGQEAWNLVREDYSARPRFDGVATGQQLFTFFQEQDAWFCQAPLRMVRLSLVKDAGIRFFEGIIHEDLLFTLQTLVRSQRSSFLCEELYMRRVHMGSTMVQPKRSIANVRGHLVCMREIEAWLHENIDSLDKRFISAISQRLCFYRALTARDWYYDIEPEEQERFLDGLSNADYFDFMQHYVYPGYDVKEVYESKTYRFGDMLLRTPRTLRDRSKALLNFRKER